MPSVPSRKIELLAPARDLEIARKAIECGADAIYIGPSSHGARAAAGNSIDDIARLVDFAHPFGVKIYATVNTIVYDNEINRVEKLISALYRAGVDALIVQDMGILRMDIPPIDLHASTQCDIRSVEKARFLASVGFSRLVLARELSLEEISRIYHEVDVELETFIHGALCVSYSGDCRASFAATGRSANRGECAQICRLRFDLSDASGNVLAPSQHYLSLRDLNRLPDIARLIDAGASSLKIEGRLKDIGYVMNTVAAYRRRIDEVIAGSGGRYTRASFGSVNPGFTPDITKSFNRGFTSYFFNNTGRNTSMASLSTPKMTGIPVGKVVRCERGAIIVNTSARINNGDGLGYFTADGIFTGFRVNRAEGKYIYPAAAITLPTDTILYRNRDKDFDDQISHASPERKIDVKAVLEPVNGGIKLTITDQRGMNVSSAMHMDEIQQAKTPQETARQRVLSKLGETEYSLSGTDDKLGNRFIPASSLATLRRNAISNLDTVATATYHYRYRKSERFDIPLPSPIVTIHDNVANHLAREFYISHGAKEIEAALEISRAKRNAEDLHVMTTRYCIRRELGACLQDSCARKLPNDLYLVAPGIKLHLIPDCSRCQMKIYLSPQKNNRR